MPCFMKCMIFLHSLYIPYTIYFLSYPHTLRQKSSRHCVIIQSNMVHWIYVKDVKNGISFWYMDCITFQMVPHMSFSIKDNNLELYRWDFIFPKCQ